jgi:hypothetical protein
VDAVDAVDALALALALALVVHPGDYGSIQCCYWNVILLPRAEFGINHRFS